GSHGLYFNQKIEGLRPLLLLNGVETEGRSLAVKGLRLSEKKKVGDLFMGFERSRDIKPLVASKPVSLKNDAVIAASKTKVTICYGTQTRAAEGFAKVKTKPALPKKASGNNLLWGLCDEE
ncbi:hypothetical protein CCACVL1_22616, partial [Corchorus capsularis]